jgi:leucyl-tRNA synthetase
VPDESARVKDEVSLVVQVNGKLRGHIVVARTATQDQAIAAALADENVRKFIGDATPRKVIVVPGKLVNIVV